MRRWGKRILVFFILGLIVFFILLESASILVPKIPVGKKESIGLVGAYRLESLPPSIFSEISRGLTYIAEDGTPLPDLAQSWEVKQDGKVYIFHLKRDIYFNDGSLFKSDQVNYNFSDVSVSRPDKYTIVYTLKESFSPFLTKVSRPLLKNNFAGIGDYKIKDLKLNGNFVESLTLSSVKNQYNIRVYHFYSTQEALKLAFSMGEVSDAVGLTDTTFKDTSFNNFPNTQVARIVNYNKLVTLFFNTQDGTLSNEKVRSGLAYALPESFPQGKRTYSPYPTSLWVYAETQQEKHEDIPHAKLLLNGAANGNSEKSLHLTIKTLPQYAKIAKEITKAWEQLQVKTTIEEVDKVPTQFQVFLGEFSVPRDPDQYSLWHKDQENNITSYANLRIDRLLEEGRREINPEARKKIYADFQKYLLADSPAAFLYFPYEYEIVRK